MNANPLIIIDITDNSFEYNNITHRLRRENGYYEIVLPLRKVLPLFSIITDTDEKITGMKLDGVEDAQHIIIKNFRISTYVTVHFQLTGFIKHLSFSLITSGEERIKFKISFDISEIIKWNPCRMKNKYPDVTSLSSILFQRSLVDLNGNDTYDLENLAEAITGGKISKDKVISEDKVVKVISEDIVWIRGGTAVGKTTLLEQLKILLSKIDEVEARKCLCKIDVPIYKILRSNSSLNKTIKLINEIERLYKAELSDKRCSEKSCDQYIVVIYLDEMDVLFEQLGGDSEQISLTLKVIFNNHLLTNLSNAKLYYVVTDFLKYNDRKEYFDKVNLKLSVKQVELLPIQQKDVSEFLKKIPLHPNNYRFLQNSVGWLVEDFAGNSPLLTLAALADALSMIWDGDREHIIADKVWSEILSDGNNIKSAIRYLCNKNCGGDKIAANITRGNIDKAIFDIWPTVVNHPKLKEQVYRAMMSGLINTHGEDSELIEALRLYNNLYEELQKTCNEVLKDSGNE